MTTRAVAHSMAIWPLTRRTSRRLCDRRNDEASSLAFAAVRPRTDGANTSLHVADRERFDADVCADGSDRATAVALAARLLPRVNLQHLAREGLAADLREQRPIERLELLTFEGRDEHRLIHDADGAA